MRVFHSLTAWEFEREFGSIYRSIFSSACEYSSYFFPEKWDVVLIPYGCYMDEQDFRGLVVAAEFFGDKNIIIADAETVRPSEAAVIIDTSFSTFEEMKFRPGANLHIIDIHMFGRSGLWGCICLASLDDVAILGGYSGFIAKFLDAVGGIDDLRDRLLQFATTEWAIKEKEKTRLLRMVGWAATS